MSRYFTLALLLILLLSAAYILWEKLPCRNPIGYSIGNFDERFGISEDEFLAAIAEAKRPWEEAAGRELFRYVPTADFRMNLTYDERQRGTEAAKRLEEAFDRTREAQQKIGADYKSVEADYQSKKKEYDTLMEDFSARLEKHNKKVEEWNKQSGSQDEYESLKKESEALTALDNKVEKTRGEVNVLVRKLNTFSGRETALVEKYNSSLDAYIARYGEAREFDQGTYTGTEINIYQFRDLPELRLVLAHELGHALGLDHGENPSSVMYYLMQDQDIQSITLTEEDKEALRGICGEGKYGAFQGFVQALLAPWRIALSFVQ